MTVSDLIEVLQKHSPTMRVVVNGYEDGYDDVKPDLISVRRIQLQTGSKGWEGEHNPSKARIVEAVAIRRSSF